MTQIIGWLGKKMRNQWLVNKEEEMLCFATVSVTGDELFQLKKKLVLGFSEGGLETSGPSFILNSWA